MDEKGVECAKCHRIVFTEDADDEGLCVDCRPKGARKAAVKAEETEKESDEK
jgi:hypothetical protein